MELVRGLHNLSPDHAGCVLTIGKFDGVHKGHQAVLLNLREKAKQLKLPAVVMVFEPQPEEVFTPQSAPARLTTLRDKIELLTAQGIERLVVVRFNAAFASQSPETFIHDLLVDKLGVKFLVVGDDFRFGKQRTGDFSMLEQAGKAQGFDVVSTASFRLADCRISSTAIREALHNSDFELAADMLGRPFVFTGKVIHGEKKGRTIGFPTANMRMNRCSTPLKGVFAVRVQVNGDTYKGVANIGQRPTLNGERMQLEVHIFNFNASLYGQVIRVIPEAKIRPEKKFASFDALKKQIVLDACEAQTLLASM
ncbi:bifunctional riboflavin kinase/FAD synthetase [Alteromonas sediminis]|uniref:Riboflavin biosynthesis protein n=1 Tax=Alteromonas sediminis TaxID=2259342 RepID=A0A3N5Z932_9ALTE|nr:bifunctional riboflavin kinase/FAD synthetase [Alteromonas sediminis]RPJ65628.1 bifunctional riboflavin kinase/FAD synthetase [Alteromonas sediminis]